MSAHIGLIVNPIAGMGGSVALHGTDGRALEEAIARGAEPRASHRAAECIRSLVGIEAARLTVAHGAMGEDAAREAGAVYEATGRARGGATSGADTADAARAMRDLGADLILFAGGDGTARDVLGAVGDSVLALGIPAGVKIHSSVFASSPASAGHIAAEVARGVRVPERLQEVIDIDECAYRAGRIAPALFGYMRVPYVRGRVQAAKAPSGASDASERASAASAVADVIRAAEGEMFFVGAGSTTQMVLEDLGVEGTLLGVDGVIGGASPRVVAMDMTEADLLEAIAEHGMCRAVITPIGGQGFIFGRGDQQFSPRAIRAIGRDGIIVAASESKLAALRGEPLRVDTGDADLDAELEGYIRVTTARGRSAVYRVARG